MKIQWNDSIKLNQTDLWIRKGIIYSLVAHAILLVLFILNQFIQTSKPLIDISQAIKVDMVGLPDKKIDYDNAALKEKPKLLPIKETLPNKTKEEKVTEKNIEKTIDKLPEKFIEKLPEKAKNTIKTDPDSIALNKIKSKQKEAFEKLKKISAIEKIKQDVKQETKIENLQKALSQTAPIKGYKVSAGSALTGIDKLDANTYLQSLDMQVKKQWALPQWLMNKPFKTRIHVKFNQQGKILSNVVMLSSGNASYDNYCLQAVANAAPFPEVPEKFTDKFSIDGVVIGFPE